MVRALRKSFSNHLVPGGIDLDITEGTLHALLGPNGSEKTTMVQILSTLLPADARCSWPAPTWPPSPPGAQSDPRHRPVRRGGLTC
jgi:ABC-type hemin transport system ATPase subunit